MDSSVHSNSLPITFLSISLWQELPNFVQKSNCTFWHGLCLRFDCSLAGKHLNFHYIFKGKVIETTAVFP